MTLSFGARLASAFDAGRRLCVGIDPHDALLDTWGLEHSAEGAEYFGRAVVEVAADHVACIKPQIAFYERFGSRGFLALERILEDARKAGVLCIADVKRGDIGSTFAAYASAWLSPGSPLEADAMTVHAYHGLGSLEGANEYVNDHGKGLFVLAATSNPEAQSVQKARVDETHTLAGHIIEGAHALNATTNDRVGSVGVVLGATLRLGEFGVSTHEASNPLTPVLAPGFGFQGADVADVQHIFGAYAPGVLVSESRSILGGGKTELTDRIAKSTDMIREAYA